MDFYKKVDNILFLDIETVSCSPSYDLLEQRLQALWKKKSFYIDKEAKTESLFFERAGIYAEFGKVVCISVGFFFEKEKVLSLKVKSIAGRDEKELLTEFKALLEKFNQNKLILCAHNGKEFDFPYLCRRMTINDIALPEVLDLSAKKPWEGNHYDTMEMWKFGDKKSYTSLEALAAIFNIPTSKDEFDGSEVNKIYYLEDNVEKIAKYCEKDVIVTAQVFLKFKNHPLIDKENIFII